MNKVYYRCEFTQLSPLRIGTGEGTRTDSDVMTDSRGIPLIPGTSIAGVLREAAMELNERKARELFGFIDIKTDRAEDNGSNSEQEQESRIIVTDAVLPLTVCADGTESTEKSNLPAFRIFSRDGVGLNERGVARDTAKYDYEVAECRVPYASLIELSDNVSEEEQTFLETVLADMVMNGVSLGARTMRGYGKMKLDVWKKEIRTVHDWLVFDPDNNESYKQCVKISGKSLERNRIIIQAQIKMKGSYSVRKYTTDLIEDNRHGDDSRERLRVSPDMSYLDTILQPDSRFPSATEKKETSHSNSTAKIENHPSSAEMNQGKKGKRGMNKKEIREQQKAQKARSYQATAVVSQKTNRTQHSSGNALDKTSVERHPVIPGTSWAGVFRHHMEMLASQSHMVSDVRTKKKGTVVTMKDRIDRMFGYVQTTRRDETPMDKAKSAIRFSETVLSGSREQVLTRVAIDRFTSAPRTKALFSSRVAWGGSGLLEIELPVSYKNEADMLRLLAGTLNDLHHGILPVGGESGVGRGLCEITCLTVNHSTVDLEMLNACDTEYLVREVSKNA